MFWWLEYQEWYGGVGVPKREELCDKDVEVGRVNNIVVSCYVCGRIGESCMRMCSANWKMEEEEHNTNAYLENGQPII